MISSRSIGGWKSFVILFSIKIFPSCWNCEKNENDFKIENWFHFNIWRQFFRISSLFRIMTTFIIASVAEKIFWTRVKVKLSKIISKGNYATAILVFLLSPSTFSPVFFLYFVSLCFFHRFRSFKFLTSDQACIISISEWFHCDKIPF